MTNVGFTAWASVFSSVEENNNVALNSVTDLIKIMHIKNQEESLLHSKDSLIISDITVCIYQFPSIF